MRDEEGISPHTLRNILIRDFVLGFLAFFGFMAAFNALVPTLPLYLARLGSSEREIGALVGTIGVSSLLSRLLVGRVLRKHSERLVIMWATILFALSFLALIVFRPFWPFFVVRLLRGIAFASLDTSAIAYAIRITPPAYRARALSYFLVAPNFASAIASPSAVFVVNEYNFTVLLLGCAGLSLCAFLLSWKLKEEAVKPVVISTAKHAPFFERKILAPAMMNFLFYFCWAGMMAFFPLYSVKCGVTNPGVFFSANGVMIIVGRVLGRRLLDTYRGNMAHAA